MKTIKGFTNQLVNRLFTKLIQKRTKPTYPITITKVFHDTDTQQVMVQYKLNHMPLTAQRNINDFLQSQLIYWTNPLQIFLLGADNYHLLQSQQTQHFQRYYH